MTRAIRPRGDRGSRRLVTGMVAVLAVGVPLLAVLYFFDQYRDPGPSLAQRGIVAAEEAVRAAPNAVGARIALATVYLEAKRYRDAAAQYDEVLRVQATNRLALLGRGEAYQAIGDLDAAAADYQALVDAATGTEMERIDPQLESAYYNLGAIELARAAPSRALEQLEKAIAINPADADALSLYAAARIQLGDLAGAIEPLRRVIAMVPVGWCEPYAQLARAYAGGGDEQGERYANAMDAFCEKRPAEAKAALEPLTTGSHATDALLGLALIAEDAGDREAAAAYYTRVLHADPTDFNAVSGLSRVGGAPPSVAPLAVASPGA